MKTTLSIIISALALTGCEKSKPETTAAATPAVSVDPWFTPSAPANPSPINLLRQSAKPGDTITLTGKILGREKPFVDDRAAFILGDASVLKPCNEIPGDACTTPWDVCCESAEDKLANTATIQLVDGQGRVLKQGLKGVQGLKELSEVTLVGTVAPSSSPEALIVNATTIHVTR
jgi:hypothetical protein